MRKTAIYLMFIMISCDVPMDHAEHDNYCKNEALDEMLIIAIAFPEDPVIKYNPAEGYILAFVSCIDSPPPMRGARTIL